MSIYITRVVKKEPTITNKLSPQNGWPGFIQHLSTEINDSNVTPIIQENFETWPANDGPTSITLVNIVSSLDENIDTSAPIKLADINVTDPDQYGTNLFYLYGTDKNNFFISNNSLYLKENTLLDFETKNVYNVTIRCEDRSSGDPFVSVVYTLNIQDIQE